MLFLVNSHTGFLWFGTLLIMEKRALATPVVDLRLSNIYQHDSVSTVCILSRCFVITPDAQDLILLRDGFRKIQSRPWLGCKNEPARPTIKSRLLIVSGDVEMPPFDLRVHPTRHCNSSHSNHERNDRHTEARCFILAVAPGRGSVATGLPRLISLGQHSHARS